MSDTVKRQKRWFLKVELVVLVLVVCPGIIRSGPIDIGSLRADVIKQAVKIKPQDAEARYNPGIAQGCLDQYEKQLPAGQITTQSIFEPSTLLFLGLGTLLLRKKRRT